MFGIGKAITGAVSSVGSFIGRNAATIIDVGTDFIPIPGVSVVGDVVAGAIGGRTRTGSAERQRAVVMPSNPVLTAPPATSFAGGASGSIGLPGGGSLDFNVGRQQAYPEWLLPAVIGVGALALFSFIRK